MVPRSSHLFFNDNYFVLDVVEDDQREQMETPETEGMGMVLDC